MNQTLGLTSLGDLEDGGRVNLELAVRPTDRLGGHILQGHVDGVGEVIAVEEDGFARRLRVGLGPELLRYAVERGSIGLGGVSLTVSSLDDELAGGIADPRDPGADDPRRGVRGCPPQRRV